MSRNNVLDGAYSVACCVAWLPEPYVLMQMNDACIFQILFYWLCSCNVFSATSSYNLPVSGYKFMTVIILFELKGRSVFKISAESTDSTQ